MEQLVGVFLGFFFTFMLFHIIGLGQVSRDLKRIELTLATIADRMPRS